MRYGKLTAQWQVREDLRVPDVSGNKCPVLEAGLRPLALLCSQRSREYPLASLRQNSLS